MALLPALLRLLSPVHVWKGSPLVVTFFIGVAVGLFVAYVMYIILSINEQDL
jgi:hypothetical protein